MATNTHTSKAQTRTTERHLTGKPSRHSFKKRLDAQDKLLLRLDDENGELRTILKSHANEINRLHDRFNDLEDRLNQLCLNRAVAQVQSAAATQAGKKPIVATGHPADETIRECVSAKQLAHMIFYSFHWVETPQGHDYWQTVMNNLKTFEIAAHPDSEYTPHDGQEMYF